MGMNTRSPLFLTKVGILVLGVVVLGVGLHSHFQSAFTKYDIYKGCKAHNQVPGAKRCPSISMERYYVAMIIITFILSLASLAATFVLDSTQLKYPDMGYHAVAAFLLLIAAIVYMVSASQIGEILKDYYSIKYLKGEKIAAGVLTLFQTFLYAFVAVLHFKS